MGEPGPQDIGVVSNRVCISCWSMTADATVKVTDVRFRYNLARTVEVNWGCTCISVAESVNSSTRCITVFHIVRVMWDKGRLQLKYCPTEEMITDVLMKTTPTPTSCKTRKIYKLSAIIIENECWKRQGTPHFALEEAWSAERKAGAGRDKDLFGFPIMSFFCSDQWQPSSQS